MNEEPTFYYRIIAIEDVSKFSVAFDESIQPKIRVVVQPCRVTRRIAAGVFVSEMPGEERFISKDWSNRYAHPTKQEALESFIARREQWICLLKRDLERAEEELKLAEQFIAEGMKFDD